MKRRRMKRRSPSNRTPTTEQVMETTDLQEREATWPGTHVRPALENGEHRRDKIGPSHTKATPSRRSTGSPGNGDGEFTADDASRQAEGCGHRRQEDVESPNRTQINGGRPSTILQTNQVGKRRRKLECGLQECGVRAGLTVPCSTCSGGVSHAGEKVCDACHAPPREKDDRSLEWVHMNAAEGERAEKFRHEHTAPTAVWFGKTFRACGGCLCRRPQCFYAHFTEEERRRWGAEDVRGLCNAENLLVETCFAPGLAHGALVCVGGREGPKPGWDGGQVWGNTPS